MKKIVAGLLLCIPFRVLAEGTLSSDAILEDTHHTAVEMRQEAVFDFSLPRDFSLSIEQEFRELVYDTACFSKSYTGVSVGWRFMNITDPNTNYKYSLRFDAGYTLRYLHQKNIDGAQPCNYLVHRPWVSLTAAATFGDFKISLRERFLANCRTDSINPLEKAQQQLELRHRLKLEYQVPGKPLKPYVQLELTNTLNEPQCPWIDPKTEQPYYGGQYLNSVRTTVGIKWRLDKRNALTFYYMYSYGKDREVNISRKGNINRLYFEYEQKHVITVAYNFDY